MIVTITRKPNTPSAEHALLSVLMSPPKVSEGTLNIGLTVTAEADGPFLSSNITFFQSDGHNYWPEGPYEIDALFGDPNYCYGQLYGGGGQTQDSVFGYDCCGTSKFPPSVLATSSYGDGGPEPITATSAACTYGFGLLPHLVFTGWEEACFGPGGP